MPCLLQTQGTLLLFPAEAAGVQPSSPATFLSAPVKREWPWEFMDSLSGPTYALA